MFWHLTMAIFGLYMKYLVSSYTRHIMGCKQGGGRRGDVFTRSCMVHGGWEVWVHGGLCYCMYEYIWVSNS